MSGAAALEVIGVVSGVLGIIQFGMDNIPSQESSSSSLMIGVGLDGTSNPDDPNGGTLEGAGGNLPDVRLWNDNQEYIGMASDPGDVGDGEAGTVTVDQGDNGQQPTYALLSANDDAICIAFVSITWPEPAKGQYAWLGDWGAECGASFFYSKYYINGDNYAPLCTWIDANGDQPSTGLSFHFPSFVGNNKPKGGNTTEYCESTATFEVHDEEDPNAIAMGDPIMQRALHPKPKKIQVGNSKKFEGRLVISKDAHNHNAERLCSKPNSAGPDFLNIAEGQFCRMADKTLWPVCDKAGETGCFDLDSHQLVERDAKGIKTRSAPYYKVEDWTPNQS